MVGAEAFKGCRDTRSLGSRASIFGLQDAFCAAESPHGQGLHPFGRRCEPAGASRMAIKNSAEVESAGGTAGSDVTTAVQNRPRASRCKGPWSCVGCQPHTHCHNSDASFKGYPHVHPLAVAQYGHLHRVTHLVVVQSGEEFAHAIATRLPSSPVQRGE
jgi:hypothetical protein